MSMIAGAFDVFADAKSAAEDLHANGFSGEITSNPRNPDERHGTSLADEGAALVVTLENMFSNLFNLGDEESFQARLDRVRSGGVVVSGAAEGDGEKVLGLNILRMHRGLEIEHAPGGAPLY